MTSSLESVDHTDAADLSVVLATEDAETIGRTLASLRAQTARDRIEVVLISLSGEMLRVDPSQLDGFAGHRLVEPGFVVSLAAGRAMGVRAARAPYIHIAETHAFPQPDWAERIVESLDGPWTAIVSGLGNANPDGAISWANLVTDYGPWLAHLPGGEIATSPPYNTAFERSFALRAVDLSEDAFSGGYDLTALLRDGGHRITFQPTARIDHANVSLVRYWLGQRYTAARARAALRSRDWPWARRAVYAVAAPLIPVILVARLARLIVAAERAERLPRLTAPAIFVGLAAQACGEFAAFILGAGPEVGRRADEFELHKLRYTGMRL
jgi:Glycosyl transferase family 2